MAPEEVPVDYKDQPEPNDKCEHRNYIHQEISIWEAFLNEEHPILPCAVAFGSARYLVRDILADTIAR
jgi:hypothetical protein